MDVGLRRHDDEFFGLPVAQGELAVGAVDSCGRQPEGIPVKNARIDDLRPVLSGPGRRCSF
jgi:hypothetical protein